MTACSDLRWGQPRDLPKSKRVGTGDAPLLGDEPSEVEDDSEDDVEGVMTGDPKETTVEGETVNGNTQGDDG